MSTKRRGKKETKQEPPTQYGVTDPVSLADLEHIHTRKVKYPTKPPPFGQATWEDVKREKEERLSKAKRERPLSTPQLIPWTLRRAKNLVGKLQPRLQRKN